MIQRVFEQLFRNQKKFDFTVLTYHGLISSFREKKLERNFHTEKDFLDHLNLLRKNRTKVFSLSEAFHLGHFDSLPQNAVCITFDDGYKNNLKALEILTDFNYPATIFLSTAYINSPISIWTVNLSLLILKGNLKSLHYQEKNFNLTTEENRLEAFSLIRNHLKFQNGDDRKALFNSIIKQFPENELLFLMEQFPQFKILSTEEIKGNISSDFSFQSHGHWHEIHHEQQNESTIREEIIRSKEVLEVELNIPCEHFCFPNGNFNPLSLEILRNNHYKAGFCLNDSKVKRGDDPMAISRITPNNKPEKFKIQLFS